MVCPGPPGNDKEAEGDRQHLDADSVKMEMMSLCNQPKRWKTTVSL